MLFAPTANAKMFGSNERLIQFWLSLYPMLLFPRTPFNKPFAVKVNYWLIHFLIAFLQMYWIILLEGEFKFIFNRTYFKISFQHMPVASMSMGATGRQVGNLVS